MSVRRRLVLTLAGITALLVIPALYGVNRLNELRDIAVELRGRHAAALVAVGRMQAALSDLNRLQRSYVASPSQDARVAMDDALVEARTQLGRIADVEYTVPTETAAARLDTLHQATEEISRLVEAGRLEAASRAFSIVSPVFERLDTSVDRIAAVIDRRSDADVLTAQRISERAALGVLVGLLISLAIAFALGIWTTDALTSPLARLRDAMATVADGSFVAPSDLPYPRRDEVGDLSRSFRTMTRKLADLDRVRAEFLGMASHDLKTPIGVIDGYVQLVGEGVYGEIDERQKKVLGTLREQTRVLTGLVNQLVDISRMEAGGLRIEPEAFEVRPFLARVERAYEALARQKDIDFTVDVDPSVPDRMVADADRLRDQVLGNLFSNAFKFTPEGGGIHVRAWGEDDHLHLDVSDTGPGIPGDQIPHIFDKYYQVGKEARARGAGLGLAIVREIVEAHDGTITAESQPGEGTAFRIILPLQGPLETES